MSKLVRKIGLVAHDAMKKDLIEWVLWNSERLIGHKFYCTGTTGTLIREALKEKHPDVEWDITILKSGPLGGDQQIGSRIVEGEIDYLFFFTDPMTHPDYTGYTQRFANKPVVSEAVERVNKRKGRKNK